MLRIYKDQAATQEITDESPDILRNAISAGDDLTFIVTRWIKSDDPGLTYEAVSITAVEDPPSGATPATVTFALDQDGTPGEFQASLTLPNGNYATAYPVYVRVHSPDVQAAFRRKDIKYQLTHTEYLPEEE